MALGKDFFTDCLGAVTVLTDDGFIFQGQIVKDRDGEERKTEYLQPLTVQVDSPNEFILLELDCDVVGGSQQNNKRSNSDNEIFQEGDIVRINVANIIAVGPSRGCLDGSGSGSGGGKSGGGKSGGGKSGGGKRE